MIAFTDVAYDEPAGTARAACVVAAAWTDAASVAEHACDLALPGAYEPGAFYKRELPALLAVLALVASPLTCVVVDGYVTLEPGRPGLGAHLHAALAARVPVVGIAKRRYAGAEAVEVVRGAGRNPLFVTALGLDVTEAAARVKSMHGPHRLPTLVVRVDHLCRGMA